MSDIARYLGLINEWIGRGVAWLTLLMVVITFSVVVLRYGFDLGSIAFDRNMC